MQARQGRIPAYSLLRMTSWEAQGPSVQWDLAILLWSVGPQLVDGCWASWSVLCILSAPPPGASLADLSRIASIPFSCRHPRSVRDRAGLLITLRTANPNNPSPQQRSASCPETGKFSLGPDRFCPGPRPVAKTDRTHRGGALCLAIFYFATSSSFPGPPKTGFLGHCGRQTAYITVFAKLSIRCPVSSKQWYCPQGLTFLYVCGLAPQSPRVKSQTPHLPFKICGLIRKEIHHTKYRPRTWLFFSQQQGKEWSEHLNNVIFLLGH